MTLVKDWHECGDCKYIHPLKELGRFICKKFRGHGAYNNWDIEPDDEVCSDFEPRGGWQE